MLDRASTEPSARQHRPNAPRPPAPGIEGQVRAVAPIALDGVLPADLAGQDAPSWDVVAPTELLIDDAYQRDLTPKSLALIRRIAAGWCWSKFKPPVCALVDGRLHVLDGQHTAIAAASHGGVPLIPVLVVPAPIAADRAAAFVSHAVDRLQARPAQVHHAAVAAGDEDAVTVAQVMERAGVRLLPYNPANNVFSPGETIALAAVRRLVDRRGAMRAREVMEILARAELAPITADHVRVAEALYLDEDYRGGLDADRITAALRDLTPKQLAEAKELAFAKRLPTWRAITAVLYRAGTAPKRGRARSAAVGHDAPPRSEPADPEEPAAAEPEVRATAEPAPVPVPAAVRATTPRQTIHVPGIGLISTTALAAGVDRWRRGGDWPRIWGPAPDDPTCAVPGSFLGAVATIAGRPRWGVVVDRTMTLWRRDRAWPAGWGPPPDHADCPVPERFRGALQAA